MSLAALFAGLAVSTPAGANISHCIAEIVGPRYRIPHGMAVGVTTPHSMRFNGPSCKEGMIKIARVMNIDEHKKDHIDNLDDSAIGPIERLLQSIGIPNSFQNSVPFEDIDDIARFIIEKQQYSYHLPEINPRPLSFENVRELLMEMCQ